MRVHVIHGIRTEPTTQVKDLLAYLVEAGFDVVYPDYGWEMAIETRFVNPMLVGTLLPYIEAGDVLIGHSNGCAISYNLMNLGAPAIGAVFINAALETGITRPTQCKFIDVYSNAGDSITQAAKIGAELNLVSPVWGEMGHAGYIGNDPLITNNYCDRTADMPVVSGHSDFFTPAKLFKWGPYLTTRLKTLVAAHA